MDIINTKALIVEPKKNIHFENITLKKNNTSEVKIEWHISSVCNSERRRYNLTKSHTDDNSFVGGHEAIGYIKDEVYIKNRYALLFDAAITEISARISQSSLKILIFSISEKILSRV